MEKLVDIFREVKRVLRSDGTVWLNLGSTYFGSGQDSGKKPEDYKDGRKGKSGIDTRPIGLTHKASEKPVTLGKHSIFKPKDLVPIPWMVALALQKDGWWLRSDIIWHKPNPMPENVTDRPTKTHEYLFLLTKSAKYYYDYEAIKEPYTEPMNRWGGDKLVAKGKSMWDEGTGQTTYRDREMRPDSKGKNKRTVWTVNTKPFAKAHFAVYPENLIKPCILAGCLKGGVVLDPFFGAGTTGLVAQDNGRRFIGIELSDKYCQEIIIPRLDRTIQKRAIEL